MTCVWLEGLYSDPIDTYQQERTMYTIHFTNGNGTKGSHQEEDFGKAIAIAGTLVRGTSAPVHVQSEMFVPNRLPDVCQLARTWRIKLELGVLVTKYQGGQPVL